MEKFDDLLKLPGTARERAWLEKRLETLSVRESHALAAATARRPPETAAEAINRAWFLENYRVYPAGTPEALGRFRLRSLQLPREVLPYLDFEQLGQMYEEAHPGLFMGGRYVEYPRGPEPPCRREDAPLPEDNDWSVKLKLASPAVPEGVWLRLPDYDGQAPGRSGEVTLALEELRVKSLEDCTLLEARCVLPEAGDLMKQYDSVTELVQDGDNLGFVLDEQGQGERHWLEKFAAALEYEGCRTLKFALDISQNLHCYEWVSGEELTDFAANHLRDEGVPEELIQSGVIDLDDYAKDLLEVSGYVLAGDESGYIVRNSQEFACEYSAIQHPQDGMSMM